MDTSSSPSHGAFRVAESQASSSLPLLKSEGRPLGLEERRRTRFGFLAVGVLFALMLAKIAFQDTRVGYPVNDLLTPWITSILFAEGKNPYNDTQGYANIWASTQVVPLPDYQEILHHYPRIYPPTTLLLISPLGLLKWRAAIYTNIIGSFLLLACMLVVMAQNLPFSWRDPRKLYFVAFALAMAPLHSGIHTANISTLVMACLCAGVGFMPRRPYLSGIAIGIAACLKPQVAIFFFAYPWLRKKWKTAFAALTVCVAIAAASLTWLKIHHQEWLGPLRSEVALCSNPPGLCSPYSPGIPRLQLLNLQTLAFQFTGSPRLSDVISWALFAIAGGLSIYLIRRRISDSNESAGWAIIAILTLLPFYQNTYGGEILLFVLYWAVENWPARSAKLALLCMLPLLMVPLWAVAQESEVMINFVRDHHLDSSVLWNGFVMLNAIWIELVLLSLVLSHLYGTRRIRGITG